MRLSHFSYYYCCVRLTTALRCVNNFWSVQTPTTLP